jgi:hypothetical protein
LNVARGPLAKNKPATLAGRPASKSEHHQRLSDIGVQSARKQNFAPAEPRHAPWHPPAKSTAQNVDHQSETADPLVVFRECAADYAWFYRNGLLSKVDAVDCAQRHAELWGVVDVCGQDAVQAEMAAAFTSAELDPNPCDVDEGEPDIVRRWELADPRDRWKWTGEAAPPEIVRSSDISAKPANAPQPCTPQSTIDAFWYVVGLRDQERLKTWLADHPHDAPFLLKLMEGK